MSQHAHMFGDSSILGDWPTPVTAPKHRAPKHRREIVLAANADPRPEAKCIHVFDGSRCTSARKKCPRHRPATYADQWAKHATDSI